MDISRFVNSKDIREYHKKIGYEYNAIEAAWLVYHCFDATLAEKHEAWQWIISNLSDMTVTDSEDCENKSVHRLLFDYMDLENKFLNEFKSEYIDWYFTYKNIFEKVDSVEWDCGHEGLFSTFEDCVNCAINTGYLGEALKIIIRRGKIDSFDLLGDNGTVIIEPEKGQIMAVTPAFISDEEEVFLEKFHRLFHKHCFRFPIPFERGDIVSVIDEYYGHTNPIVFTGINNPPGHVSELRDFKESRETLFFSGMCIWGYEVDDEIHYYNEDHTPHGHCGIQTSVWWTYMDVEYYQGKLSGINGILEVVSSWIKGEFGDDLCLLLAGYQRFLLEHIYRKTCPALYSRETLQSAGIRVNDDK